MIAVRRNGRKKSVDPDRFIMDGGENRRKTRLIQYKEYVQWLGNSYGVPT
jgi:hypothetical protein